jgi:hypothetical protein
MEVKKTFPNNKVGIYPVHVSIVKCFCNICETGEMEHTEIIIDSKYEHECTRCRTITLFEKKFPFFTYEWGSQH